MFQKVIEHLTRYPLFRRALILPYILGCKRTMVPLKRLKHLKRWCLSFKGMGLSFVECGVGKGGCLALMKCYSDNNRIWGFDSFGPMPPLSEEDEGDGLSWVGYECSGDEKADAVMNTFKALNLSLDGVNIIQGYFETTLERTKKNVGKIALLRLDNDWYRSTKYCLEQLYEQVIPGGVVLVDDYGAFAGCKKAVDEFRANNNIHAKLKRTDPNDCEYYWVKESSLTI